MHDGFAEKAATLFAKNGVDILGILSIGYHFEKQYHLKDKVLKGRCPMAHKAKLPHHKSQKGSPVMLFVTIGVLVVIFVAAIVVAMAMPEQSRPVNSPAEESQQGSTPEENIPLAEDDPILWLTEDELAYTLPEELEDMVHQRMKLCKAWLGEM